jgi:RNA polymerase sigma-70 factor (ECF subfamily)
MTQDSGAPHSPDDTADGDADEAERQRELLYDAEVAELLEREAPSVYAALICLGADRANALGLTHDAFLVARANWSVVRDYDKPGAWVRRVAINMHKRGYKAEARWKASLTAPYPLEGATGRIADHTRDLQLLELQLDVRAALRQLSPREQEAVVFHHALGMTEPQTAAAMGVSVGAVKRYASDGRRKLREHLKGYENPHEGRQER